MQGSCNLMYMSGKRLCSRFEGPGSARSANTQTVSVSIIVFDAPIPSHFVASQQSSTEVDDVADFFVSSLNIDRLKSARIDTVLSANLLTGSSDQRTTSSKCIWVISRP